MTTVAPIRAKPTAVSLPMPALAPVIATTLPVMSIPEPRPWTPEGSASHRSASGDVPSAPRRETLRADCFRTRRCPGLRPPGHRGLRWGALGGRPAALVRGRVHERGDPAIESLLQRRGAVRVDLAGGDGLVDLLVAGGDDRVDDLLRVDVVAAGDVGDGLAALHRVRQCLRLDADDPGGDRGAGPAGVPASLALATHALPLPFNVPLTSFVTRVRKAGP